MAVNFPQGFRIQTNEPVDQRIVVDDIAARNALDIFGAYEGLVVYVKSENALYTLDIDPQGLADQAALAAESNWTEIGTGVGHESLDSLTDVEIGDDDNDIAEYPADTVLPIRYNIARNQLNITVNDPQDLAFIRPGDFISLRQESDRSEGEWARVSAHNSNESFLAHPIILADGSNPMLEYFESFNAHTFIEPAITATALQTSFPLTFTPTSITSVTINGTAADVDDFTAANPSVYSGTANIAADDEVIFTYVTDAYDTASEPGIGNIPSSLIPNIYKIQIASGQGDFLQRRDFTGSDGVATERWVNTSRPHFEEPISENEAATKNYVDTHIFDEGGLDGLAERVGVLEHDQIPHTGGQEPTPGGTSLAASDVNIFTIDGTARDVRVRNDGDTQIAVVYYTVANYDNFGGFGVGEQVFATIANAAGDDTVNIPMTVQFVGREGEINGVIYRGVRYTYDVNDATLFFTSNDAALDSSFPTTDAYFDGADFLVERSILENRIVITSPYILGQEADGVNPDDFAKVGVVNDINEVAQRNATEIEHIIQTGVSDQLFRASFDQSPTALTEPIGIGSATGGINNVPIAGSSVIDGVATVVYSIENPTTSARIGDLNLVYSDNDDYSGAFVIVHHRTGGYTFTMEDFTVSASITVTENPVGTAIVPIDVVIREAVIGNRGSGGFDGTAGDLSSANWQQGAELHRQTLNIQVGGGLLGTTANLRSDLQTIQFTGVTTTAFDGFTIEIENPSNFVIEEGFERGTIGEVHIPPSNTVGVLAADIESTISAFTEGFTSVPLPTSIGDRLVSVGVNNDASTLHWEVETLETFEERQFVQGGFLAAYVLGTELNTVPETFRSIDETGSTPAAIDREIVFTSYTGVPTLPTHFAEILDYTAGSFTDPVTNITHQYLLPSPGGSLWVRTQPQAFSTLTINLTTGTTAVIDTITGFNFTT